MLNESSVAAHHESAVRSPPVRTAAETVPHDLILSAADRRLRAASSEGVWAEEHLGFFAHEVRNLLNASILAFELRKHAAVKEQTEAVLHGSLMRLRALVDRALTGVRLSRPIQVYEPLAIGRFIEDLAPAAAMAAAEAGVAFVVTPGDDSVIVGADELSLAALVMNLLQNAFKFTKPRSLVDLRVIVDRQRVRVEIQDQCGGLPAGNARDLFRRFEQRDVNRSGLGLGLSFCLHVAEAHAGRMSVRDLPGVGCVFAVDLPRLFVTRTQTPPADEG